MPKEALKTFEGFILLNFRNGKSRLVKRLPKRVIGAAEVPVHYKLDVVIPDTNPVEMVGKIEIPATKLTEIVFDYMDPEDQK